jgi:hypothetical protein
LSVVLLAKSINLTLSPRSLMLPRFRSGRTHSVAMAALVPAIHAFNARRRGCAGQAPDVRDARDREKGATRGCAMMMKIRIAVVGGKAGRASTADRPCSDRDVRDRENIFRPAPFTAISMPASLARCRRGCRSTRARRGRIGYGGMTDDQTQARPSVRLYGPPSEPIVP